MSAPLRTVLVDDEPLALAQLQRCAAAEPALAVVGATTDARVAATLLETLEPDLAILDVQLAGTTGLALLQAARRQPQVIFATAFDAHAVMAFELGAVDYLLKPFSEARFRQAVARAVRARASRPSEALPSAGARLAETEAGPLARVFLRDGDRVVAVPVGTIDHLEAADDYVIVRAGGRRYTVLATLRAFEARLDPAAFLRVHRSHLVSLAAVTAVAAGPGGRCVLTLRDGSAVVTSRAMAAEVRARFRA